jgi:hypothetical protein
VQGCHLVVQNMFNSTSRNIYINTVMRFALFWDISHPSGNCLPTFRDKLVPPETSVRNCHSTLRDISSAYLFCFVAEA